MNETRYTFDANDVREACRGKWDSVLSALGVNAALLVDRHGPCPGCGGKDRFRFDDKDGSGSFICSQGCGDMLAGDGIALLAHCRGIEWSQAVNVVGSAACPEKGKAVGSGIPRSKPAPAGERVAPEPQAPEPPKKLDFDLEALRRISRPDILASREYFAKRSPIDVAGMTPSRFLELLYRPEERILIFEDPRSQGQFIHWRGHGDFRLAKTPNVKATKSALPRGGRDGVWFLAQPVDGSWYPNARAPRTASGEVKLSRRSKEAVTSFRFMVLESDDAPEDLWLNFLAQLPLPIAAIYTSGRRSVHALLEVGASTKEEWDLWKRKVAPLFTKLGADPGALSAVRLTRLPGCYRGESLQELLFLNPSPDSGGLPICCNAEQR